MTPTADDVARAIVAASRETGAPPEAVANGDLDAVIKGGHKIEPGIDPYAISRARIYAAYALRQLFPDIGMSAIARCCGVRKATAGSFFSAVDQRGGISQKWCKIGSFQRVVDAVEQNHDLLKRKIEANRERIFKDDLPTANRDDSKFVRVAPPYRPPAGTATAILADDEDDGPVFDVGGLGEGFKRREPFRRASKREMEDDLRAAVERTAAMQPPKEE